MKSKQHNERAAVCNELPNKRRDWEPKEAIRAPSSETFIPDTIAATMIGLTAPTLRRWRHEGRGPRYCKVGSSVRYKVADLEEFISKRIVETRDSARTEVA
jgi:predicted DNA-binding transcriptional regulator AlpA